MLANLLRSAQAHSNRASPLCWKQAFFGLGLPELEPTALSGGKPFERSATLGRMLNPFSIKLRAPNGGLAVLKLGGN